MKTLIAYSSKTGNTKKLAEAADDLIAGEKVICPISEAPDPAGFDLVVLGFWLQAGKPDPKSSEYLSRISDTRLFLLATHGAAAGSAHVEKAMAQARELASGARLTGTFSCPGEVSPAFLEKARKKDTQPPWLGDAPAAVGHPDNADIGRLKDALKAGLPEFMA